MGEQDQSADVKPEGRQTGRDRHSPSSAASLRRAWLDRRRKLSISAPRGSRKPVELNRFSKAAATGHIHPAVRKTDSKYSPSGWHYLSSTNIYGLTSRSERFFPEAYRPIEDKFWREIDDRERDSLIARQAEVMRKVSFRDREELAAANASVADKLYEEAVGRRRQAIRRRLSFKPPKRYQDRKKWEEEKRRQPLERRYVAREIEHLENTSFYQAGPLDVPILIQGVLKRLNQKPEAPPKRLKLKRPKYQDKAVRLGEVTLPGTETKNSPMVGINMWNNRFGLQSSAVSKYPEAYREVSSVFWRTVSQEHRNRIALVQAQAMEKVGFERKTQKFFIEDFDPSKENRFGLDSDREEVSHLESRYNDGGDHQYDPSDECISLQNRYADQEFVSVDHRDKGPATISMSTMNTGIVAAGIAFIALLVGFASGMTPLIWGIVIACIAVSAGVAISKAIY